MEPLPPDLVKALERSGYSKESFAAHYDAYRPSPPPVLLDLLPRLARVERPALVVDLGSGTGLSTRFWAGRADAVVGVEPNAEMRAQAEQATNAANVRYVGASASATGLPEACADIVTCSQSLQWMEPEPTFAEVDRILRPGGVFAAYEYRSLVTQSWEAGAAWLDVREAVGRLRRELGLDEGKQRWPISIDRFDASGRFRFTAETSAHGVEAGDVDRLVGFLLSEGSVSTLLERVSEDAIGLDRLRALAAAQSGEPESWHLGYTVWLGVK